MDYEKKYKEIVGQIRKAYLYAQTDSTKAVLKEIFPELIEQKPACSEEDSFGTETLISVIKSGGSIRPELRNEFVNWLQSLKGRVQPKQEWGEEDEEHIDSLLKRLDALCRNKFERTRFAISEDRDWLKSLKERIGE